MNTEAHRQVSQPLLQVQDLRMIFPVHGGVFFRKIAEVFAVDGISFSVNPGETLGIVGESGCGKSTLGKAIFQLYRPTSGSVKFQGQELTQLDREELRRARRNFQVVFQDPYESLNPRMTVREILTEPFLIHGFSKEEAASEISSLLERVGLQKTALSRYPHEFSGGQRQRIGIARAISLRPKLILCDEPVSALDVSIQSQIINLLVQLQKDMGLTYLFVAHDLSVVKHISDRVMVMYLGKVVEMAPAKELYAKPAHPYTKALIASIPLADPTKRDHDRPVLAGEIPSPRNPPAGCRFHTRCPIAKEICKTKEPILERNPLGTELHSVACHFPNGK